MVKKRTPRGTAAISKLLLGIDEQVKALAGRVAALEKKEAAALVNDCPFCGRPADMDDGGHASGPFAARCTVCGARGPICRLPASAAAEWNRISEEQR